MSLYNVAFAVFQPVAIGLFDQFISARMLDRYPPLYQIGQRSKFYNHRVFWFWILNCFYHSLMLFYCLAWAYGEGTMINNGFVADNWLLGETVYTCVLITITWKAAIASSTFVKFTYVAIFGSITFWFLFYPAYATVAPMLHFSTELYGLIEPTFTSATVWFSIILIPIAANLRDYTYKL